MFAFGGVSKSNYMTFFFVSNYCQAALTRATFRAEAGCGPSGHLQGSVKVAALINHQPLEGGKVVKLPPRLTKTFASSQLPVLASKSRMGFGLFGMDTDIYKHGSSQDLCRFSSTVQILHKFGVIK